jgi:hypothetical protein
MVRLEILQKLNPAPDALLGALAPIVDDSMLQEIAAADYGMNIEENLAQLIRIRDNLEVLAPMRWEPREVLNLTCWSEPNWNYPHQTEQSRRGHFIRAFACAALLQAYPEPENIEYFDSENATLAQLLSSLPMLGTPFEIAALRFMAWRAQDLSKTYEDAPFHILALLVLILRTRADLTTTELHEIIDYLYVLESQIRSEQCGHPENSNSWLLGSTIFNQKHDVWRQIGKEIGVLAASYEDSTIETALQKMSKQLDEEAVS